MTDLTAQNNAIMAIFGAMFGEILSSGLLDSCKVEEFGEADGASDRIFKDEI